MSLPSSLATDIICSWVNAYIALEKTEDDIARLSCWNRSNDPDQEDGWCSDAAYLEDWFHDVISTGCNPLSFDSAEKYHVLNSQIIM